MALIPNRYLAATEYAQFHDPAYTRQTPYGWFVHIPQFPDRGDAHQLFDFRIRGGKFDPAVFELFRASGIVRAKLTGHDDDTIAVLLEQASDLQFHYEWMFLHRKPSGLTSNPDVKVELVDPGSARETEICALAPALNRNPYHRFSDARMGGKLVFAWVDGQPVGITGWYVVDGFARFRFVKTLETFRRRGVASTLINFVIAETRRQGCRGLVIFCDDEKTIALYEKLGFVRNGFIWSAVKMLNA